MAKYLRLISEQTSQYLVFFSLSFIVLIFTYIANKSNPSYFQRYFGSIHPLIVVLISFITGLILFSLLMMDGRFAIYRHGNIKGLLVAVGLATAFALAIVLVDRNSPWPADINVPYPDSCFFYPAIAYVVELIFHILPFCLVYFSLVYIVGDANKSNIIWISILIVALLEPVFQVILSSGQQPGWVMTYLGLHLFMFNIVQLLLFRRYDFITMYTFRFSYYILWHIVWGHFRLNLLF